MCVCGKSWLFHRNCHFSPVFLQRTTQFYFSCGNCHHTQKTIIIMMLLGFFVLMCLLASNHLGGAYHVRLPAAVSCAPPIGGAHHSNSRLMMVGSDNANHRTITISLPVPLIPVQLRKTLASGVFALSVGLSLQLLPPLTTAAYAVTSGDDAAATAAVIEKVPLLTKRTSDLQQYADIARGFKLLRSGLLCYVTDSSLIVRH